MSALQHYVHQLENNVLEYCYCSVKIVFITFDSENKSIVQLSLDSSTHPMFAPKTRLF